MRHSSAVFLDRDGVIIEDIGYVCNPAQMRLLNRVPEAIRLLNERSFVVIVITNQSGVARGYYPESAVHQVHAVIAESLSLVGAHIDDFYYCPHHPEAVIARYRLDCACRKPRPGMVFQAAEKWGIDLQSSFVIGDKRSDLEVGQAVGACTVLVQCSKEDILTWENEAEVMQPDWIAKDLFEAVLWILKQTSNISLLI